MAQWKELIAKVDQLKGQLARVTVGDFNTRKFDAGTPRLCDEMVPAMRANGYGEVLNQTGGYLPFRTDLALPSPGADPRLRP